MKRRYPRMHRFLIGITSFGVFLSVGMGTIYAVNYVETKNQKNAENRFVPSVIKTAVQEEGGIEDGGGNTEAEYSNEYAWEKDVGGDGTDIYTAPKKVKILNVNNTNENNADAYIRVCIIPGWVCEMGIGGADDSKEGSADDSEAAPVDIDVTNYAGLSDFGTLTRISISDNVYAMGDVTFTLADDWSDNWIFNSQDGYFYHKTMVKPGETTGRLLEKVSVTEGTMEAMNAAGVSLKVDVLVDSIQTEAGALAARWGGPETLGIEAVQEEDGNTVLQLVTDPAKEDGTPDDAAQGK